MPVVPARITPGHGGERVGGLVERKLVEPKQHARQSDARRWCSHGLHVERAWSWHYLDIESSLKETKWEE